MTRPCFDGPFLSTAFGHDLVNRFLRSPFLGGAGVGVDVASGGVAADQPRLPLISVGAWIVLVVDEHRVVFELVIVTLIAHSSFSRCSSSSRCA